MILLMFLHLSVILFTGGVLSYPWGRHPPLGRHPPRQKPLLGRHPPGKHPLCTVHAGIWSTSGRYASYWSAILFKKNVVEIGS